MESSVLFVQSCETASQNTAAVSYLKIAAQEKYLTLSCPNFCSAIFFFKFSSFLKVSSKFATISWKWYPLLETPCIPEMFAQSLPGAVSDPFSQQARHQPETSQELKSPSWPWMLMHSLKWMLPIQLSYWAYTEKLLLCIVPFLWFRAQRADYKVREGMFSHFNNVSVHMKLRWFVSVRQRRALNSVQQLFVLLVCPVYHL